MIEYSRIIESIENHINNPKAKSVLLKEDDDHPTPYLHTRDSLLLLIIQLLKSAQKIDEKQYNKEDGEKYIYATEIEETSFATVSDQWIQGLYIFENYKDLLSELYKWKQSEGDVEAIKCLENDPELAIENFE